MQQLTAESPFVQFDRRVEVGHRHTDVMDLAQHLSSIVEPFAGMPNSWFWYQNVRLERRDARFWYQNDERATEPRTPSSQR